MNRCLKNVIFATCYHFLACDCLLISFLIVHRIACPVQLFICEWSWHEVHFETTTVVSLSSDYQRCWGIVIYRPMKTKHVWGHPRLGEERWLSSSDNLLSSHCFWWCEARLPPFWVSLAWQRSQAVGCLCVAAPNGSVSFTTVKTVTTQPTCSTAVVRSIEQTQWPWCMNQIVLSTFGWNDRFYFKYQCHFFF